MWDHGPSIGGDPWGAELEGLAMRQSHAGATSCLSIYAGDTVPVIVDRLTGNTFRRPPILLDFNFRMASPAEYGGTEKPSRVEPSAFPIPSGASRERGCCRHPCFRENPVNIDKIRG